jgi:hypothetical protein
VVLTCWKDLGTGDDPHDPLWIRHHDGKDLLGLLPPPPRLKQRFWADSEYRPGSVFAAFEKAQQDFETPSKELEAGAQLKYSSESCRAQVAALPPEWFRPSPGEVAFGAEINFQKRSNGWLQPLFDIFNYADEVLLC